MYTPKTKLLAIVLTETARRADMPQADMVEALNLAIKYLKFGTDLSVLEKLEYPLPEV